MNRSTNYLPTVKTLSMIVLATLVLIPANASGLPIQIGSFPAGFNFSPPEYTIAAMPSQAVATPTNLTQNVTNPVLLEAGITSLDGTDDTLRMSWTPTDNNAEATAGWELVFGVDPDLLGGTMSLSVNAPGGIIQSGPNTGQFSGITSISIQAMDDGGNVAGGWGFNTDQSGGLALADDLTASGGASILNNVMHDVVINIPTSVTADSDLHASAVVTQTNPAGLSFIGPNFVIPGNHNFENIVSLQYYENGNLRGEVGIPGTGITSGELINYWDHLSITVPEAPVPEPSTSLMLLGLLGFAAKRRSLRRA